MYNPFGFQIKLDISTGERTQVTANCTTAKQYFNSLEILNKHAHLYKVVYLATEVALKQLEK